jgi:proteasome accessory factor B
MTRDADRYSPAVRFTEVRALLNSTGGATVYEIAERLGVSTRTAIRYLRAMERSGEKLYDELDGARKVWRLMPSSRQASLQLTTSQMISLYLSRQVFDFLDGTGFKEDLDDIFRQLGAALKRKDFVAAQNLDKKLFDVNEAPYRYEGRIEHVDAIITGLIKEERISALHGSVLRGKKRFLIDPYTLLVYKKGLYLAGFSHQHKALRTFALAGFRDIRWKKGDPFPYPEDYSPTQLVEGSFGLFGGPSNEVEIFFDQKVARYVRRRQWSPSQQIERVEGGLLLRMRVRGTVELVSWVLAFGDKAEVRKPEALRAAVAAELTRAMQRYRSSSRPVAKQGDA